MEDQSKQLTAYENAMDLLEVTPSERVLMREGVRKFFAAGWPSNYVTLGMAKAAGGGLEPMPYRGLSDMNGYQELMKANGHFVPPE